MNRSSLHCLCAARAALISLGLATLPILTGCAAVQIKLGMKLELAKIPATSMDASLDGNPAIAPGQKSSLIVQIAGSDGKTYVTEGAGKGKILWKELYATSSVVSVDKKGHVSLPRDPRGSDGQIGHVTITAPSHPGLSAELTIPLRYDYPFQSAYSGGDGMKGTDGTSGSNGTDGTSGSIDLTNPSAGGNGTDGGNGSDGSNGGDGSNGPAVTVRVTMHPPTAQPGDKQLIEAAVSISGHRDRFYLIDPQGGSLTISSSGGAGGAGGKGGSGGRGGSGGIGTPNGSSGHDGLSGQDGRSGFDGHGGSITVTYDPQAQPYLSAIHTSNPGSSSPVYQQQPVPPLW